MTVREYKHVVPIYLKWRDSTIVRDARNWIPEQWLVEQAERGWVWHYTVGYLLKETDEYYLVTANLRQDGLALDAIAVPKVAVVEKQLGSEDLGFKVAEVDLQSAVDKLDATTDKVNETIEKVGVLLEKLRERGVIDDE